MRNLVREHRIANWIICQKKDYSQVGGVVFFYLHSKISSTLQFNIWQSAQIVMVVTGISCLRRFIVAELIPCLFTRVYVVSLDAFNVFQNGA